MISRKAIVQWQILKPFDVIDVADANKIRIDDNYKISNLKKEDVYDWNGQIGDAESNGYGRITADFGIYEGYTSNGLTDGYGRLIWNNKNYYIGQFSKGQITG